MFYTLIRKDTKNMKKETYYLSNKKNETNKTIFLLNLKYSFGIPSNNELIFNSLNTPKIQINNDNRYQL